MEVCSRLRVMRPTPLLLNKTSAFLYTTSDVRSDDLNLVRT